MHRSALVVFALLGLVRSAHADDPDPLYACKVPAAGTKLTATFKPDVSLRDLAAWVTSFTCRNVVFSTEVAKNATRVNIVAPTKMTPKQALQLFVDAVQATGLLVEVKPDTIIVKLGPNMPKNCPDVAAGAPAAFPDTIGGTGTMADPSVANQQAIDKGTRKIDDTHYEITRALLDAILANPMEVAKGARVVPSVKNGTPNGLKLYAIRPGSLWAKLGLANGDTLVSVNGQPLVDAEKALDAYTKLRDAKALEVALLRRGQAMTISVKVTP